MEKAVGIGLFALLVVGVAFVRKTIEVSESTLYPVLRRLQKDGYLIVYDRECGGRNRRYYQITETGEEKLAEYRSEWESYSSKISELFSGEESEE